MGDQLSGDGFLSIEYLTP